MAARIYFSTCGRIYFSTCGLHEQPVGAHEAVG
jgi:hypothetical protein